MKNLKQLLIWIGMILSAVGGGLITRLLSRSQKPRREVKPPTAGDILSEKYVKRINNHGADLESMLPKGDTYEEITITDDDIIEFSEPTPITKLDT